MKDEITLRLTNRAIVIVLLALGLVWVFFHATRIVIVLFIAILLASAVSSAANRLERFHLRRGMTILLAYLLITAVLAGAVALIVPLITSEVQIIRSQLPDYEQRLNDFLTRLPHEGAPMQVNDIVRDLGARLTEVLVEAGRGAREAGSVLITILLIFVIGFFLAEDARFAERIVIRFFPPEVRLRVRTIMGHIGDRLGYWVRAQLLLALFFGVTFGIGLAILRMPFALTLGTVGAILEIIPYVGGLITVILTVLVAATTGKLWLVIAVVAWYTVVVNVQSHIIGPKLVGEIVGLHPLVVVIALFLGAETLGILGALLAVPIALIVQTLLDEFWTFDETVVEGAVDEQATTAQPATKEPDQAVLPGQG